MGWQQGDHLGEFWAREDTTPYGGLGLVCVCGPDFGCYRMIKHNAAQNAEEEFRMAFCFLIHLY